MYSFKSKVLDISGSVDRVLVLVVKGLCASTYATWSGSMPSLSQFTKAYQLRLPGTNSFLYDPSRALSFATISAKQQKKRKREHEPRLETVEMLLMSQSELELNGYPGPSELHNGFEMLTEPKSDYEATLSDCYGIDCEMVTVEGGKRALARCSVVDCDGTVVFDSLVKPPGVIEDYKTRFSGITEKMLRDITTSVADVRAALRQLLPASAVLCGHSLEHDLISLGLCHTRLV